MDAMKSGWKTSEFWFTLAAVVVNVLVLFGVLQATDVDPIIKAVSQIIGGVFGIVAVGTYNNSRAMVKTAMIENGYEIVDDSPSGESSVENTPVLSDNSGLE